MDIICVSQKISLDFGNLRRLSEENFLKLLHKFLDLLSGSNLLQEKISSTEGISQCHFNFFNRLKTIASDECEDSLDAISTVLIESAKLKIGNENLK